MFRSFPIALLSVFLWTASASAVTETVVSIPFKGIAVIDNDEGGGPSLEVTSIENGNPVRRTFVNGRIQMKSPRNPTAVDGVVFFDREGDSILAGGNLIGSVDSRGVLVPAAKIALDLTRIDVKTTYWERMRHGLRDYSYYGLYLRARRAPKANVAPVDSKVR